MPDGSEGTGRNGAIPDPEVDALAFCLDELGESRDGQPRSRNCEYFSIADW